jgi:hypothetical protein
VPPASTQTLPREITFNAPARCLQQYPLAELAALRGAAVQASAAGAVHLPAGTAKQVGPFPCGSAGRGGGGWGGGSPLVRGDCFHALKIMPEASSCFAWNERLDA